VISVPVFCSTATASIYGIFSFETRIFSSETMAQKWEKFDVEEGHLSKEKTEAERIAQRDSMLLFTGRSVRMFSYGALTIVLIQYLEGLGLQDRAIGALLTVILLGDLGVSLWLTSRADIFGRRRCLLIGAILKVIAGCAFGMASPDNTWILFPAGIIGVVSSTGGEIGPFLPIEQAALIQARSDSEPATLFAWYSAAGYLAQVAPDSDLQSSHLAHMCACQDTSSSVPTGLDSGNRRSM
jgi:Na+/melibiose symporter-like transporter